MSSLRRCPHCERELSVFHFRARQGECELCSSGRQRWAALCRHRPYLAALPLEAHRVAREWETARLALSRALRPAGLRVEWRGFEPFVRVIPRGVENPR